MINNIRQSIFYVGDNYFHPSVSRCSNGLIMTMQTYEGASDKYGPLMYALSGDDGKTWDKPCEIEALGLNKVVNGVTEGIADVRPFFHELTGTVIATGCNTWYGKNGCVAWDPEFKGKIFPQFPVYAVYGRNGIWSGRKMLAHDFFSNCANWRTACAQTIVFENGDVLLPIYFQMNSEGNNYSVCTVKCSFDGSVLKINAVSNILAFPVKRGFIEPSLACFEGKHYMTIRAEDGRAYFSCSPDGLNWGAPSVWQWDDGSYLKTSSTQQHWISSNRELYLIYVREDECNKNLIRWRAPLFAARFLPGKNCLQRASEKTLFPLKRRNGIANLMGNFHAVDINPSKSIVSDGSLWLEYNDKNTISDYYGEVWLSEIEWSI